MSDVLTIESHAGSYDVAFDEDVLASLDAEVPVGAHFIIAEIYGARMANVLASPSVLLIKATEQSKSLDRFPAYVERLVENGLRRDHVLIAISGGIIQDITCFLAATMLRGDSFRRLYSRKRTRVSAPKARSTAAAPKISSARLHRLGGST